MRLPRAPRQLPVSRGRLALLAALVVACFASVAVGVADPPVAPLPHPKPLPNQPDASERAPRQLPAAPERPDRPAAGAGSVAEFVEGLTRNDAAFEVLLGQGRILTTKADLAAKGKMAPLLAVGDPTVADFAVVSNRQIRVVTSVIRRSRAARRRGPRPAGAAPARPGVASRTASSSASLDRSAPRSG